MSHKRHLAQGLDPETANSKYPPKVQLISKYERRTDRRTFGERKNLFEVDLKKSEQKELVKPKVKVREDWVKGKKAGGHSELPEEEADAGGEEEVADRKASIAKGKKEQVTKQPQEEAEEQENNMVDAPAPAEAVVEEESDSLW